MSRVSGSDRRPLIEQRSVSTNGAERARRQRWRSWSRGRGPRSQHETVENQWTFRLTEDEDILRRAGAKFAETGIRCTSWNGTKPKMFPMDLVPRSAAVGLTGIQFLAEEYGGSAMSAVDYCICIEELARACGRRAVGRVLLQHTMATKIRTKNQDNNPSPPADGIFIKGARVHNLKNVTVTIPRNKLVVVTGVSGSGKSSLTIDTLFAEGQRRYAESLSAMHGSSCTG